MSQPLRLKWEKLQSRLQDHQRVLVAFSGGCDSAFLLSAARHVLGKENVLAVTAVSASLPQRERLATERLAAGMDVEHLLLETQELSDPAYAANPTNRCFFCKNELFSRLTPLAEHRRMKLLDGFNLSDRSDYRPGFQAAQTWNVGHPLEEALLKKRDIRVLSRWRRLPTWNKPASPCLSSRIPYGTVVSSGVLSQIERAEAALHDEGFSTVRVRHHASLARIEVPLKDLARLTEPSRWSRLSQMLKTLGYERVEADSRGFQSGRLNEAVGVHG